MPCRPITLGDGSRAIVCGSGRRRQRCACGNWATLLCDWTGGGKGPTCDAPICTRCALSPAVGKDLCRTHAAAFAEWKARRAASSGERPGSLPLPDPDAPAVAPAGVSAPRAAQSRRSRSRPQPEAAHA